MSGVGLLYVISGCAVFSFADRTYTVKPGDMVFLTPESNYTSTAQELFEHYTINFAVNRDTYYGDIVLRQLFASEWHILHVGNDSLCLSLFSELCDTWKQKQASYRMLCMARLYQLTSGLYTVSQVAEKCGFQDVNYFSRFFKKHTHVSPSVYRNTRLL